MKETVRLPVRTLCEFLLQSGSIDNRYGGEDRALEGAKIHRKLQKQAGPGYRAEVFLSVEVERQDFIFLLEGRADGVFPEDSLLTVDEIKTTGAPMENIRENYNAAHWGQAQCYAYMLCLRENQQATAVRLTYYQIDTEEIKHFKRTLTLPELESFVYGLLDEYEKWAKARHDWNVLRDASIKSTPFPFPAYRAGQREMAVSAYRALQQGGRLFCQAPTGIGKTVSSLFPAVKAMGEGLVERIFYLTAKTITRQAAEDACTLMRQKGLRLKTITLTAKDKICFLEERDCNPVACPYADGYYDRARDAVFTVLGEADRFDRETIAEAARRYRVCPFELSLDLSLWCDAVICDYNYLFDPVAALKRFFADKSGEYAFLVDEAHNLVDRARDMYSAPLAKSQVLSLKKALGKGGGDLRRTVRALNEEMTALRKLCGEQGFLSAEKPEGTFCIAASKFTEAASVWLEEHKEATALRKQVLELFFETTFFQRILELYDEHYCTFYSAQGNDVEAKLLCLDPSALLSQCLDKGRGAVIFSATLSPLDYYRDVLGSGPEAVLRALPSPFSQENLCLLCADTVSTKYKDRDDSLLPIAQMLHAMVSAKQGNYLAYFPSYRYLRDVYQVFCGTYPQVDTVVQTGDMDEAAREAFLERFDEGNTGTLLGFCVLGGVFSEGVDLKGDRLIGTAVVGVGLPQICPEMDLLRDYYDRQRGRGFEYAYRYPGMNKVMQAVGRVIRGAEDRGVALLIDNRFPSRDYQALFPPHWRHWQSVSNPEALSQRLADFWAPGSAQKSVH